MRRFAVAVAVTAVLFTFGPVQDAFGQGRFDTRREARFMINTTLSYSLMTGDVADSLDGGPGAEIAGLYQFEGIPLRVGAGAGYSRHGIQEIDASANRYGAVGLVELLLFSDETEMIPYLQARGGWMKISNTFEDLTTSISGLQLGAVVGVDIPLGDVVSLDVSGQFSWFSGGDLVIDGQSAPDTSRSGSLFAIRAGAFFFL